VNRIGKGSRSILLVVLCIFLFLPTSGSGKSYRSKKYKTSRYNTSHPSRKSYVSSRKRLITYRVRRGDCLFKIARKYRTTVKSIQKLNGLWNNNINRGQKLKVYKKYYVKIRSKKYRKKYTKKKRYNSKKRKRNYASKHTPTKNKLNFRWPVYYVRSVQRDAFSGVKSIGILIKGPPGSSVRSSASGKVVRVGYMRGYGKYIVVKHKNRFATVYAKLNAITVNEGQFIKKGSRVGFMSRSYPQIHFQIDYAGKPLNPLTYLR
jgi:lipoprotein NlpD